MDSSASIDVGALVTSPVFWAAGAFVGFLSLLLARLSCYVFPGKSPPIFEGIPLIGGMLKFLGGPIKLIQEGYEKCGDVFTVPVFHKKITFLIGPSVTPHFFKASDELVSQKEVYEFNVPTFGPGVVYDVEPKVRNEQFRFFADALKTQRLQEYVPLFKLEAKDFFEKYGDTGVVDLGNELGDLITLTASRTLLGREIRENLYDQVSLYLKHLDEGMLPISVFFPYLPIPAHRKRDEARKQLAETFKKVLRARRESGAKEPDMLQHFMESRYQKNFNGRLLNDDEIGGLLIAALFAGQHTSSITSAWTGYCLLDNRKWWDKVVEEQKRIVKEHGDNLDVDVLNDMPVLHSCIKEALRMNPPLVMLLRQNRKDFSVTTKDGKQYVVPKGNILATSATFTHRLSSLFKNPMSFEPDRSDPPREEDKEPLKNISFGHGRHSCMGHTFAYLQIKVIWSIIVRNFEMELVDEFPEPDFDAMVIGPKKCRIRYTRRKNPLV
ncbi:hypothetical protein BSKO_03657 [Bryopsis sp. KO-2023]|nr:hypothetical protein BSKO_03657 [Bryopsis sp. KO-2023]